MPVEDFLDGKYLERADVVLTRRDYDLTSWLIRWTTNSPFSHAAMVFTGPQFESGFSNTFVIEASTRGVDLTDLRDYIADKSTFLAIKRVKEPWFDEVKQSRVRGLLLDKIKSTYDYWAIGHLARSPRSGPRQRTAPTRARRSLGGRGMELTQPYVCPRSRAPGSRCSAPPTSVRRSRSRPSSPCWPSARTSRSPEGSS